MNPKIWPFLLGVGLSRLNLSIRTGSKWFYLAVLAAASAAPNLPQNWHGTYDLVFLAVAIPVVLIGIIGSHDASADPEFSRWMGNMSYPLYLLHYPAVRILATIIRRFHLPVVLNVVAALLAASVLCYAAERVFYRYEGPA